MESSTQSDESKTDDKLEFDFKIMAMFIENAKSYTQLSGGAIAVSVVFMHEVVGIEKDKPMPMDWALIASWLCFLLAVGAGVHYQYLAVKFLEAKANLTWKPVRTFPMRLVARPWPVYLIMVLAFYAGAIFFIVCAIRRM
jgi:hypothetical protein